MTRLSAVAFHWEGGTPFGGHRMLLGGHPPPFGATAPRVTSARPALAGIEVEQARTLAHRLLR
jgi:hypothetical protein